MSFDYIRVDDILAIHADQIGRYGGGEGIRDPGLLEAALLMAVNGKIAFFLYLSCKTYDASIKGTCPHPLTACPGSLFTCARRNRLCCLHNAYRDHRVDYHRRLCV